MVEGQKNGKFSQNGKFGQNGKLGHPCVRVTKGRRLPGQRSCYYAFKFKCKQLRP